MFPTPWLNVGTPGVRSKGWGVPFPLLLWTPPGKLLEAFVPRVQRLPGVQRCSQPATAAAWYHQCSLFQPAESLSHWGSFHYCLSWCWAAALKCAAVHGVHICFQPSLLVATDHLSLE